MLSFTFLEFYTSGLFASATICFIVVVIELSRLSETKTKNFAKIGLYYHPLHGFLSDIFTTKDLLFYLVWGLIIFPALSWITVVYYVCKYIRKLATDVKNPDKVNENYFKLSVFNLSADQVLDTYRMFFTNFGLIPPNPPITQLEIENRKYKISVESELTHFQFQLFETEKVLTCKVDWPLSPRINYCLQYKIENLQIYVRTIYYKYDSQKVILDNVVIDSAIEDCKIPISGEKLPEEELTKRKKYYNSLTEWRPIEYVDLEVFILSFHQEVFLPFEFRKSIRKKIERIRNGCEKFEARATELGLSIPYNHDFKYLEDHQHSSKKQDLERLRYAHLKVDFNIELDELQRSEQIISYLERIIEGGPQELLGFH